MLFDPIKVTCSLLGNTQFWSFFHKNWYVCLYLAYKNIFQKKLKKCPNLPNSENVLKFSYARKKSIFWSKDMFYSGYSFWTKKWNKNFKIKVIIQQFFICILLIWRRCHCKNNGILNIHTRFTNIFFPWFGWFHSRRWSPLFNWTGWRFVRL